MRKSSFLIVDGDFGGDEMQLMAVAIANKFNVLGLTTVFGNADIESVTKNAGALARMFNMDAAFPIYEGNDGPLDRPHPEKDGAHGSNGIGGVELPYSLFPAKKTGAVDFIIDALLNHPEKSVTITATGPQSNIAAAIRKNPEAMRRVKEIVIMGGAIKEMKAADRPIRKGNITPVAEFNFYQDPEAADDVLKSGLPVVVLPMECTHGLTLTPSYEAELRNALSSTGKAEQVVGMMEAPRKFDMMKFGIHPVMHDVNTTLYLIKRGAYRFDRMPVQVSSDGECLAATDKRAPVLVAQEIVDPTFLHSEVKRSLLKALSI